MARVKHARKCIKTVGAGRRGARARDLVAHRSGTAGRRGARIEDHL